MRSKAKQGGGNSGRKLYKVVDKKQVVCRDANGRALFDKPFVPPLSMRSLRRRQMYASAMVVWNKARAEREAELAARMRALGGY